MAANRVSSSIQGDQVPIVGRRPRRTRVIGTILVAGLILGMLAVPVGSVSAEIVEDPCLTCVAGSSIAASAARFSDSGATALLASPAAAATDARYSALVAFYTAEYRPAAVPVRHNDSGVGAFLATRSEADALADAASYSGLAAFHAAEAAATAVRFNDSGAAALVAAGIPAARFNDSGVAALLAAGIPAARFNDSGAAALLAAGIPAARFNDSGATVLLAAPAAAAADARYSALVAFYAAEYRPAAVPVRHNDSGVAVAFAVP